MISGPLSRLLLSSNVTLEDPILNLLVLSSLMTSSTVSTGAKSPLTPFMDENDEGEAEDKGKNAVFKD